MVSVVAVSVECGDEEVTSQAGISASLVAVPLLVWPVPLLAPAEAELSSVRWEADSVVRANLAVVVLLLTLLLLLLVVVLVVPFLPGVGSRDVLGPNDRTCRTLLPVVVCALGSASLDRMGRSRTQT